MTNPLHTAERIGILGDLHGDIRHLLDVSEAMEALGVTEFIVAGDFGFVWPGRGWVADLDRLARRLEIRGQTLFWVDGNHEDFRTLYSRFPVSDDGLRRIRPNIIHMPRGYRASLTAGRSLAILGGAHSIDRHRRTEGRTWWPEEGITQADLDALGHEHADVMIGHDAPLQLPPLDDFLRRTEDQWPRNIVEYAKAGRQMLHQGFLQVRPKLYVGGHFHLFIDETVTYTEPSPFTARVVLLADGSYRNLSQAILHVPSLHVEFFSLAMRAEWAADTQLGDQLRWLTSTVGTDVVATLCDTTSLSQVRHWTRGFARVPDDVAPQLRLAKEVTEKLLVRRTPLQARQWWQTPEPLLADRSPAEAVRDMGAIVVGPSLHELALR